MSRDLISKMVQESAEASASRNSPAPVRATRVTIAGEEFGFSEVTNLRFEMNAENVMLVSMTFAVPMGEDQMEIVKELQNAVLTLRRESLLI